MATTSWAHLPNKIHIDQVLVDLANHQDLFVSAWQQAWKQACKQAYKQAHDQGRKQVWDQALNQARDHALNQAWRHARSQAYDTARCALLALIAYDDASKYLTMPADQAIVYGELVGDSQYLLLKPYLLVKNEIALLATA
jgi:hypothetical protein